MTIFDPKEAFSGGDPGPTAIEIPGKTAMLLLSLAQEMGARTPGEVVAHALGVLKTVRDARKQGRRVILRDPGTGREVDLAL